MDMKTSKRPFGIPLPSSAPLLGNCPVDLLSASTLNLCLRDHVAEPSHVIQGDVLRMEDGHYVVKQKNGKEGGVATDNTTKIMGQIKNGDRVVERGRSESHVVDFFFSPLTNGRNGVTDLCPYQIW